MSWAPGIAALTMPSRSFHAGSSYVIEATAETEGDPRRPAPIRGWAIRDASIAQGASVETPCETHRARGTRAVEFQPPHCGGSHS